MITLKQNARRVMMTMPAPLQGLCRALYGAARNTYYTFRPLRKWRESFLYHSGVYRMSGKTYDGLHLGCGGAILDGFCNVDANRMSPCDLIAAVQRIKLADATVGVIYCSHVFEHIARGDAPAVLTEWHRVLKPGGKLYIALPDIEALFRIYLDNLPRYDTEEGRYQADLAGAIVYGGQTNEYDFHFNGYSFTTLKAALEQAGFQDVQRFDRSKITFNPYRDAAYAEIRGIPVSLNVLATK